MVLGSNKAGRYFACCNGPHPYYKTFMIKLTNAFNTWRILNKMSADVRETMKRK
jgi:hypothetical protein